MVVKDPDDLKKFCIDPICFMWSKNPCSLKDNTEKVICNSIPFGKYNALYAYEKSFSPNKKVRGYYMCIMVGLFYFSTCITSSLMEDFVCLLSSCPVD